MRATTITIPLEERAVIILRWLIRKAEEDFRGPFRLEVIRQSVRQTDAYVINALVLLRDESLVQFIPDRRGTGYAIDPVALEQARAWSEFSDER